MKIQVSGMNRRLGAWAGLLILPLMLACAQELKPLQAPGIENLFQAADRVFSGSQPEGDESFAALQRLGVKTIISVDGTKPEVERAAKFGLRYIHLPHGYDGIPTNTVAKLVKAAQTAEGPFYVHCHHGKHRGPAAVGVICQATAGWTTNRAVTWLKQAGTSADYAGLFAANAGFKMPSAQELALISTDFPSRVEVSGLVDGMVAVDHRWENLKAIQKAGWRTPGNQPDLVPATEALLLREAYRELGRSSETRARDGDFLEQLRQAEATAAELHALLKEGPPAAGSPGFTRAEALGKALAQNCSTCHKTHRN